MIYGSLCSGIEAASVAWHPLGWRPAFYAENDAFPSAVLAHHYPQVPNFGDLNRFQEWPDAAIDVLVGGTPCQSFSIAGLRAGLADPRGNLCLTYLAIAARYRPDWLVWENVPGVFSSDAGRDLAAFLGGLGQLGYGWAYRVLDAQYFDLAQRRPRVFVVGSARGWARAAAVLFEPESLQGHPAPSRSAPKDVAPAIAARTSGGGGLGTDCDLDGGLIARCVTAREGSRQDYETETLIAHALSAEGCDASEDGTGRGTPLVTVAAPLSAGNNADSNAAGRRREDDENLVLAFAQNSRDEVIEKPVVDALKSGGGKPGQSYPAIRDGMSVRRLTPRECERLMGYADDYTLIPFRGKPAKDTPRYKALGNSMPVPVMRWIGKRIELVESVAQELAA